MVTEDGGSTTGSTTVRLAIVNDYEVVVRGLAHMLDRFEDLEVVELDTTSEVIEPVDVALFDTFAKEEENGEVKALVDHPGVKHVVVYSWNLDRVLQRRAIDHGVSGYLSKAMSSEELAQALREVVEGKVVESPASEGTEELEDRSGDGDTRAEGDWPGRDHGLTARESEVLALITQGLSNQDIATRTHLSINSVKTYIRHAYHKIGVTSRSRAVLWGIDHGFRPDSVRVRR